MSFRVLLIYPPASKGGQVAANLHGHRGGGVWHPRIPPTAADRLFMPYGLLTIAAELQAHGFQAEVLNLSTFSLRQAAGAIRKRPADLFGLSCYTFHRHTTAALGSEIRAMFPDSHLTVGGPHVSALPLQWLDHYPAFDSVVIGEGEATALELAECLRDGRSVQGVAGTAYRVNNGPALGPPRNFIAELDLLGKPWRHFDYGFLVTSRGCPGKCTFCCSPQLWGQRIRFRSAENVLEEIQELVASRGHRFLNVKDDTFTAHKGRVLAICQGIQQRGLVFRWVCDTRVDLADQEILAAMRRAGCVKINLGIESGSPQILRNLNKRIDLSQALKATADARDLGIDVRFYLIVGNRGETPDTVRQTLEFVEKARPTHFLLQLLAVYPGTEEFRIAQQRGLLSVEDYFDETVLAGEFFQTGEDSPQMGQVLSQLGSKLGGDEQVHAPYTIAEREQILKRHPDMLRSYTELAISYCQQWRLQQAERVLHSAEAMLGSQTPELMHYLACLNFAKRDFATSQEYFHRALQAAPRDSSLIRSWQTLRAAGPMNYQRQGEISAQLFADLRSTEFLFLPDGSRQLTMAPSTAEQ